MDWSTLGCARNGHLTFAPDEPALRARMSATTFAGPAWQCLRCGSFVAGEPNLSGPASQAPVVPRGKEIRSRLILRLFAIERFIRAVVAVALAYALWHFRDSQISVERIFDQKLPLVRDLFRQLGFNITNSKFVGLLQHALTLSSRTLVLIAAGLALYAVIELVEGVGLWLSKRWGEYFAFIATSLGLPVEIYDLSHKITVTASLLFALNLVLVLYLVLTKRLFGVRGGKKAYDARLKSESVVEAAVEAAASGPMPSTPAAKAPTDTVAAAAGPLADTAVAPGHIADN
ncbi:MAG TPA: DUF2127 domain-containing protein [Streptosporangiaceae bacterium]